MHIRSPASPRALPGLLCLLAAFGAVVAARAAGEPPPDLESHDVVTGGLQRHYWIRRPERPRAGAGLVLVLHGSNGDGLQMRGMIGRRLEPLAARAGFVVAYPDGFERHWNDCRGGASYAANRRDVDDPGFLRQLVAAEQQAAQVDPRRVFVVGLSNGGQMALRLALEDAPHYAAVAAIGANLPAPQGRDCSTGPATLPVALFVGTADPINPFHGGLVRVGDDISRGYVLDAWYGASWFAARAGQSAPPLARHYPDLDRGDRSRASRFAWLEPGKPPVLLYVIENGGHTIPGSPDWPGVASPPVTNRDIDAARESWAFFERVDAAR